jgi:hypothetical protein
MKNFTRIVALAGLTLSTAALAETPPSTEEAPQKKAPIQLPGDITSDGKVDAGDLVEVFINWGNYLLAAEHNKADLNFDGMVDVDDMLIVLENYGSTTAEDSASDVSAD